MENQDLSLSSSLPSNHPQDQHTGGGDKAQFQSPRHWVGPEELNENYWKDPAILEKRGQEFYEKPVEWLDKLESAAGGDAAGMARRDFLTVMGASMAMAGASCVRRPVHKIIPYIIQPQETVLGVPSWYSSTCQECSVGCGLLVKTRESRPIKLEGNPEHPINQGSLCTSGQASLLNLYDPDRLTTPMTMNRSTQIRQVASWEDADAAVLSHLQAARARGGRVRLLSGLVSGESSLRMVREFLRLFKDGKHVVFEALELEEVMDAQEISYGHAVYPHYRFEKAHLIVSLGSDFLENGLSPLEHARAWSRNRKFQAAKAPEGQVGKGSAAASPPVLSKMVCFETTMTVTGANADQRYGVRPGDELTLVLGLIAEVLRTGGPDLAGARDRELLDSVRGYSLPEVARELEWSGAEEILRELARELLTMRGKSLVIGGAVHTKNKNQLALQVAINCLNTLLGNEGQTIDGKSQISQHRSQMSEFLNLVAEMEAGKVEVLILHRSNPDYVAPRAAFASALKKVPFVVAVADRIDETALFADWVLPESHFLESWGDAHPQKALFSLQQPTIEPLHGTRAMSENLLAWGKALGPESDSLLAKAEDWHAYLQGHWSESIYPQVHSIGSFELFWESALRSGVVELEPTLEKEARAGQGKAKKKGADVEHQPGLARTWIPRSVAYFARHPAKRASGIDLVLYERPGMQDGRSANNAWLQEFPDPISSVTWDNFLNVSPSLAESLRLKQDDVVEITSASGALRLELPVHVQPGMHAQVVSVAVGYGRRSVGKVGNGAGVDVFPLVEIENQRSIFAGLKVQLRKTGRFYQLAATQWHTSTENRPIINDITLSEYQKDPHATCEVDPHLRLEEVPSLWPKYEYKSYRWGMAIDLNACTGCGACMIACQAENNIAVVGRNQVRVSRVMHWIRIDRYYSGPAEQPNVVFQPMLCQHCENAPCETVCPVLATVHNDEGLNVQIYNRCVGTRYCQNNCPYKVRKFNFFDYWKSYEGTLNMAWNPDVTVRSRGIMEKCTFCVQRIRDAKDHAKEAGERVGDGDFQVACQQTCPTEALVFGDLNNPTSSVAQLAKNPRAFKVLEVLNTQPAISYLTKVRNQPPAEGGREGEKATHGHS